MFQISETEIQEVEKLLIPDGCRFPEDARRVIRCWESKDVAACPGSGKTTVLLAKLKLLADRMPLDNGAGICVLSHTNVAVNEIKAKMSDYTGKLMSYPNYVGTIQSFIDKFVTDPYLERKYRRRVQKVDNRIYAEHLCQLIYSWKYQDLARRVLNDFRNSSGQYADEADHVANLYIRRDGALCSLKKRTPLAGGDKSSALQFQRAIHDMLAVDGLIKYADAYAYAEEAVEELETEYTDLFSNRFKYVFIDEYQDCKKKSERCPSEVV